MVNGGSGEFSWRIITNELQTNFYNSQGLALCAGVDKRRGCLTRPGRKLKVELPTSKMGVLARTDLYLLLTVIFYNINGRVLLSLFAVPTCSSWHWNLHFRCCSFNRLHPSPSIMAHPSNWQKCEKPLLQAKATWVNQMSMTCKQMLDCSTRW